MASEITAYDHLVALVQQKHDTPISQQEAHSIARNLMGYCELVLRVNSKKEDMHRECGGVLAQNCQNQRNISIPLDGGCDES